MNSRLKAVFYALLGLFCLQASCQETDNSLSSKIPEEAIQVVKDSTTFALQFYQQAPQGVNICFSPYSISSAFAMVYTGARGDTQKEIASVLRFPKDAEKLDKGWEWLNHFLTFYPSNSSEDVRLRIANALWMQMNFPVLPAFRDMMTKYFDSSFRFVDFKSQPETARATINAWVKQNTFGKIIDILPPSSIENTTRMVLISALYLKAKWQNQFDAHASSQQPFFTSERTIETVLSMNQSSYFPYLDTPEASILEMPYIASRKEGPQFSMLFILPHDKEGLSNIEKGLTADQLEQWMKGLEQTHAIVTIPKFKILLSSNLNEDFKKMGMTLPFTDLADFSGISAVKGLKVGSVLHKVYLSVDETGSEAAAATAITLNTKSALNIKFPVIFQADHPFLYLIIEKHTGVILFMGRVVNPNKT